MTKTWKELAGEIGFTTQALSAWRKKHGAPKTTDFDAWTAFIDRNNLGLVGNRLSARREQLLCEKLEIVIEREGLAMRREAGELVLRSDVDSLLMQIGVLGKTMMLQHFVNELPPRVAGASIPEIRDAMRTAAAKVCDSMREGCAKAGFTEAAEPEFFL